MLKNKLLKIMACIVIGLFPIPGMSAETQTQHPGEVVNGLKATLKVQENTFHEREPIPLEIELHNVSNTAFSIFSDLGPTPTPAGVIFHLRNGDSPMIKELTGGNKTPFRFSQMEPGGSQKYQIVMTMRHLNEPALGDRKDFRGTQLEITRVLEPGYWTLWLQVKYQTGAGKVKGINDAWEGVIVSNPVSFRVVK